MGLLAFALELYFAATLWVSGLAKIDNPKYFLMVLAQQRILPKRSHTFTTRTLPWMEIIFALLLVTGIFKQITAILLLLLFIVFLGLKIFLLATGRTKDCGCYGSAKPQEVNGASITVSFIIVLFAVVHLWLVTNTISVVWIWRLTIGSLFIIVGCFFLVRVMIRRRLLPSIHNLHSSIAGGLDIGEHAPAFVAIDLEDNRLNIGGSQEKSYLLTFVSPGCSVCPGALKALQKRLQEKPSLVGLVVGSSDRELNRTYAKSQHVQIPFLTDQSNLIQKIYHVQGFPFVFIIDEEGVIRAKGVINNYIQLQALLKFATMPTSSIQH